jgi:hypothetical protein
VSFAFGYLYDENLAPSYAQALRDLEPLVDCRQIGDVDAPPKGTLDPQILEWLDGRQLVLITNNRASMPVHLADHLAAGGHIQGIVVIKRTMSPGELADELLFIAGGSFPDEYLDRIIHLPIT